MSRAFVKEDDEQYEPVHTFALPKRRSPGYPAAAARVLLEAARTNITDAAEAATGYRWGDPALKSHVQNVLDEELARDEMEQDRRLIQVARRFIAHEPRS